MGNSQARTAGNPNLPAYGGGHSFGGFQAWINKNQSVEDPNAADPFGGNVMYKGGSLIEPGSPGVGSEAPRVAGTGTDAPATAPLALSDIDLIMQRIYQNGGKANKLMLSPKLRRDFSDLMVTDSGVRRNIDMDGKLRQSVDV